MIFQPKNVGINEINCKNETKVKTVAETHSTTDDLQMIFVNTIPLLNWEDLSQCLVS